MPNNIIYTMSVCKPRHTHCIGLHIESADSGVGDLVSLARRRAQLAGRLDLRSTGQHTLSRVVCTPALYCRGLL
jgi:hypothetical protein